MKRTLTLAIGLLVLASAAPLHAQQLEPVELDVPYLNLAIGEDFFSGTLPLGGSWSDPRASGTVLATHVDGEIEVTFTASMDASSGVADIHLQIVPDLGLGVPNVGAPETPVVFQLDRVDSNRVLTSESASLAFSSDAYQSTLLGTVAAPQVFTRASPPISVVERFIPGHAVQLASAGFEAEVSYQLQPTATETFTEVFRIRALAVHPVGPASVAALPDWGLALLAGVLLGLTIKLAPGRLRDAG